MSQRSATLVQLLRRLDGHGARTALVALRDGPSVEMSHAALARDVGRLAAGLVARGVRPGEPVAVCAPSGPSWVVAAFGALAAGATLLPLDVNLGGTELIDILRDAGCRWIFATPALATRLTDAGATDLDLFLLDGDGEPPSGNTMSLQSLMVDADWPTAAPEPGDIAALLYTSGTTGTPKGVPLTHASLAANVDALVTLGVGGPGDRIFLPLPLHHVYPLVVGLLAPLATGAAVVFPTSLSGPAITDGLRRSQATVLIGVPRLYTALADGLVRRASARSATLGRVLIALLGTLRRLPRALSRALGRRLFHRLRAQIAPDLWLMVAGGARLDPETWRTLELLGWTVLAGYGMTEAAPLITFNPPAAARPGTEGRAMPGIDIRIDRAADDAPGEILVRGPTIFTGYHHRPAETQAAFAGDGWFRTGDLGQLDRDGYLTVVGRTKELIVLADGKKVLAEEIESAYSSCPFVRELAILPLDGALVALAVPDLDTIREAGAQRVEELVRDAVQAVARTVPSYRRPTGIAIARQPLPRTPVGKLRRHLLADIYRRARERRPESAPEETLSPDDRALRDSPFGRRVWAWVRQRFPHVPLTLDTSPQLDLGIDSLGWVTLDMEIESRFSVRLGDERIARILTLRDLLRELQDAASHSAPTGPPLAAAETTLPARGGILYLLASVLFGFDRMLMRLLFGLRVDGADRVPMDGPVVIAPNHASWLDPLVIVAALPRRRLRAIRFAGWTGFMFRGPLSRLFSRVVGVLPVDPDRMVESSLSLARQALEHGAVLVWFPEGQRTTTGELQEFKPGIAALLRVTGATVVPTHIAGSFEAAPKGRLLPRLVRIRVRFGRPRTARDLSGVGTDADEGDRIAGGLRAAVADLAAGDPFSNRRQGSNE